MEFFISQFTKLKEERLTVLALIASFLLLLTLMFFSAQILASQPKQEINPDIYPPKHQNNMQIRF